MIRSSDHREIKIRSHSFLVDLPEEAVQHLGGPCRMTGIRVHVDPFRQRQVGVTGPCTDHNVQHAVRCQVRQARVSGTVRADLPNARLLHQPVQPAAELIGLVGLPELVDQDVPAGSVGPPPPVVPRRVAYGSPSARRRRSPVAAGPVCRRPCVPETIQMARDQGLCATAAWQDRAGDSRLAYVMARRLVGGPVLLAWSDAAKEVEIPPAASPTRGPGPAATGQAAAAVVDRPGGDGGVGAAVATGTTAADQSGLVGCVAGSRSWVGGRSPLRR
jgi:hypothetical protein